MTIAHLTVVIPMPQLGVSVEEGTVVKWHKAIGDEVIAGEPLCDIATDKIDTEISSPETGVIARILAQDGVSVRVGEPLAELAVEGRVDPTQHGGIGPGDEAEAYVGSASKPAKETHPPPEAARASSQPVRSAAPQGVGQVLEAVENGTSVAAERSDRPIASPVARRVAEAEGIAISEVKGTGFGGRIRKIDVVAALQAQAGSSLSTSAKAGESGRSATPPGYQDVAHTLIPLSHQRRAIAEHMVRSRQTAAHMTTEVEVDMTWAGSARDDLNSRGGATRVSFLAVIARAACAALTQHPELNATITETDLIAWNQINLAIAVDTPTGLLAPVIKRAERLTATGIAEAIDDLAARARTRRLTPEDVRAGTFTISNPGSVGAVSAMAIINQPQVAILGTPRIVRRPVVVADATGSESIAIRPVMMLALTFDHRAVDGAEATRYLVEVKDHLESWETSAYG